MVSFGLDIPAFPQGNESSTEYYEGLTAVAAEAGFSRLWVGDHALWRRPRLECFSLLALLSGMSNLELGTGVLLAPLRHPIWIAKSAASLAHLTQGRFTLGLGVGGEFSEEFERLGVDVAKRGDLLENTIEVCRAAWSGTLTGSFLPLPDQTVPIWLGGRSHLAQSRAGRLADGYLGLFLTPARFANALELIDDARRAAGRAQAVVGGMAIWVACESDGLGRAADMARFTVEEEYGLPASRFERYIATGTADELIEVIAGYIDQGAEHIHLHIAHPDVFRQLDLLASRVLPMFSPEMTS